MTFLILSVITLIVLVILSYSQKKNRKAPVERNPFELIHFLSYFERDYILRKAKISIKTKTKNHVVILEEVIQKVDKMADLGTRTRDCQDIYSFQEEYKEKCCVVWKKDYATLKGHIPGMYTSFSSFDSALYGFLQIPGTEGSLILDDSEDGKLKHSIRRQDVESVRIVRMEEKPVKLVDALIERLPEDNKVEVDDDGRLSRPPYDV